jgi:hypothetical protein
LVEGIDGAGKKTGNIYNEYITSGEFFKIPKIGLDDTIQQFFVDLTEGMAANHNPRLEYDYYYI